MTYYCAQCHVYWHPYMTLQGACRGCGGGTKRSQENASDGVQILYAKALIAEVDRELHERFEAYYARRGEQGPVTETIDTLEVVGQMPTFDPEEAIRVALLVAERADRDRWIRYFNRIEAAINHHRRDTEGFATDADERLWRARDRIVRDAHGSR